ncbi:hypothetical protein F5880DRAFT_1681658 [Lentinula raphanica]|nr:hypothetical protein F5880DRAFT_1681658 [Lentinula raphanica]
MPSGTPEVRHSFPYPHDVTQRAGPSEFAEELPLRPPDHVLVLVEVEGPEVEDTLVVAMVSFYHPPYQSLYPSRSGKLMQEHFIWEHVLDEDVRVFLEELDSEVRTDLQWTGFDWQAAALDVVTFW